MPRNKSITSIDNRIKKVQEDLFKTKARGGFHKFGKPVFPLRRQYPKQRREPQHRSDVEAFL